jgi:hypothetical protein
MAVAWVNYAQQVATSPKAVPSSAEAKGYAGSYVRLLTTAIGASTAALDHERWLAERAEFAS